MNVTNIPTDVWIFFAGQVVAFIIVQFEMYFGIKFLKKEMKEVKETLKELLNTKRWQSEAAKESEAELEKKMEVESRKARLRGDN
jgi:predicted CopG family antitoxin